jgi:hypothetical protein
VRSFSVTGTATARTTACTIADSANPRISAHRISHVIDAANSSACPMAPIGNLLNVNDLNYIPARGILFI